MAGLKKNTDENKTTKLKQNNLLVSNDVNASFAAESSYTSTVWRRGLHSYPQATIPTTDPRLVLLPCWTDVLLNYLVRSQEMSY